MDSNQPQIVIVGAGMAGLSAAASLVEYGLNNVVILEASDRIGGRIHTIPLDDGPFPIELGANWIHGCTHENASFELADKLGVLYPYRLMNRFSCRFARENGTDIDRATVTEAYTVFKQVDRKARKLVPEGLNKPTSKCNDGSTSLKSVLDGLFETELREYKTRHPDDNEKLNDMVRVFNAMKNHSTFHEGDDLSKVAWEEDYDDMPGGDVHIPGGYIQLLNHLLRRLPEDCVNLNSEVININTSKDHVDVTVRKSIRSNPDKYQGRPNVDPTSERKANTELYKGTIVADHVIVTCSLGYLKKHHSSLFNPSLPADKIDAIERLGFGRVNKIFLEFDRPVLGPKYQGIGFAWDHSNVGEGNAEWFRDIFGFDQVFTRDTTLLGWIASDGAEHMETLFDEEIGDTCVKLLMKFLNDDTIPNPKRVLVSRWCSNPYVLGCYSFMTPSLKAGDHMRLFEPVCSASGEPRVLFAGEATIKEYFGCTHGARTSGMRAAQCLCSLYRNTPPGIMIGDALFTQVHGSMKKIAALTFNLGDALFTISTGFSRKT